MPGIANIIAVGFNRGGNWSPTGDSVLLAKILYWGKYSEISGGQMPNKVTGATDYLTVAGAAGSETYQAPNTAPYIAADHDSDSIWFKTDETRRTVTTAELIGYDFARTLVKYDNTTPYQIREIIILLDGETLTTTEENNLRDYMDLSIWWDNTLNAHGNVKGNRGVGQSIWTAESVYDDASVALFARMATADGVAQTDARKVAIDTAIKALKAASLFDTKFDRFIVYRAKGNGSRMLNWIQDAFNAEAVANGGTLTQTDDVGCHSDGTKSYIRSNYIPSTAGGNMTLNNACCGYKVSGTIFGAPTTGHGGGDGANFTIMAHTSGAMNGFYHRVNCLTHAGVLGVSFGKDYGPVELSALGFGIGYLHYKNLNGVPFNDIGFNLLYLKNLKDNGSGIGIYVTYNINEAIGLLNVGTHYDFAVKKFLIDTGVTFHF